MSGAIRVMHVMGHMMGGGVEATVMNHYRHINRNQVQFDFVVDSDSTVVPIKEIEKLGGRVFFVPPYKQLDRYLHVCEELFRSQRPDIVHSNINSLSVFPLLAAKRAGVRVRIAHSHSTANPKEYSKTLVKDILRPFSRVMPTNLAACSNSSGRWLFGNSAVNKNRVRIIKNAIDLCKFSFNPTIRTKKRIELGVDGDQLVIGQVGRMCFQKNQLFMLDVFNELLKVRPDSILVFAGDGALMEATQDKAHRLGIEASVKFLGVRRDVSELYQAFDVLALPSKYEGLPVTGIEAQAVGLPTVVSDAVSKETFIVHDLMQSLRLSQPICDWVDALLNSPVGNSRNSGNHERMIEAGYEIQYSANRLCDWYTSLVLN